MYDLPFLYFRIACSSAEIALSAIQWSCLMTSAIAAELTKDPIGK